MDRRRYRTKREAAYTSCIGQAEEDEEEGESEDE